MDTADIRKMLQGSPLHLLAGCPPCQGFSTMRRLNKKRSKRDRRNNLVLEYLRFVKDLKPLTIMMENVPGLVNYTLFKRVFAELQQLGYQPKMQPVKIQQYGVPQRRKRLVLVGSLLGDLEIAKPTGERVTVRDVIGRLEAPSATKDPIHRIVKVHTPEVMDRIKATPKDGGSRADVPEFELDCHKDPKMGFRDVYGRLRWDDFSSTITGGVLTLQRAGSCTRRRSCDYRQGGRAVANSPQDLISFRRMFQKAQLPSRLAMRCSRNLASYNRANIMNHLQKSLGIPSA